MRRGTEEGTDRRTVSRRRFIQGVAATGVLGVATPASAQEGGTTTATSPTTEYVLGAQVSGWIGQEPAAIEDEVNPTLRLVAGRTYTISWVNLDSQQHQLQILDAAGETVAESDIVATQGATGGVEFEATPDVAAYRCSIHQSMRGSIRVEQHGTRTTASTSVPNAATHTPAPTRTERTPADAGTTAADGTTTTTDSTATTDSLVTTIREGDEPLGVGGASSRGQPGFGLLAGLAGVAGLLGLRWIGRRGD